VACRLLRQGIYLHVPVPPSKNVFVRIALIENDTIVGTSDISKSRNGHGKRIPFLIPLSSKVRLDIEIFSFPNSLRYFYTL
jgi:hypothetical protein